MNTHDEHSANILLYLDNALKGQDLQDFLVHLAESADCRKQLGEEQALSDLLLRSRPLYTAPGTLRTRMVAAVAQQAASRDTQNWRRKGAFRLLPLSPAFRWAALIATIFFVVLGLTLVPAVVQHAQAATFVDAAVTTHYSYENDQLPLEIQSSSPETVTAWFAGKVPFQFRLPSSQSSQDGHPTYMLAGARLVSYKKENAALVTYRMKAETISLLIASDKFAVAAGGDEIRSGGLTFHHFTRAGLNVMTWSTHGLTYALVSSLHTSGQHSCLVCHQNMADKDDFR
jgi:anti-sigma factor RsiW